MHYRRDFLHGDPLYDSRQRPKRPYTKKPATQRFWAKVDKDGPVAPGMDSPCWLWTHSQRGGYGSFSHDGKNTAAHRFSYSISKGPIPHGYVIDHQCHTTLCVNPDHLRAITQKQNSENRRGAQSRNVTGVRGVSFVKGKYVGHVGHHGKVIYVGTHDTVEDAAAAVLAKRLELYTHNDEDLQFFQKTGENNLA